MLNTPSLKAMLQSRITAPHAHNYGAEEINADGKLLQLVEAVYAEQEAITRDIKTSDAGKRDLLVKLGSRTLSNLDWLVRLQDRNAASRARVEAETYSFLRPPKDETDTQALRRELRAQAIVAHYHGSEHNPNAGFLQALDRGDVETALALLDCPGGSLISDEIKARGARAFVERTNPQSLPTIDAFQHLQEYFTSTIDALGQWLISFGLDPKKVVAALNLKSEEGQRT